MASIHGEEAAGSPNAGTIAMDAKLMVATDRGDVKKLKDLLNKEDATTLVVVKAVSKPTSKKDQSQAGSINPKLLALSCDGSCTEMDIYLRSKIPPMTQESPARGSIPEGKSAASAARDMEEGVDNQPVSLAAPAFLKGVTPDGNTALHEVASNGDGHDFLMCANIICDRDSSLMFAQNHKGDTPLHCAARAGNSKMVSHLIYLAGREGADTKLKLLRMENKLKETALHEAVRTEDGRLLGRQERALLDAAHPAGAGQVLNEASDSTDNKEENDASDTPEEKNIVKMLMSADPKLANYPADGISPFYLAILLQKSTIALTLYYISGGDLSYSGPNGQNALHLAVLRNRDIVMIELLLCWNMSLVTQVDNDGSTPLHFASSICFLNDTYLRRQFYWGHPWCRYLPVQTIFVKLLEASHEAVYQADNTGFFPIHVAASVGSVGAIKCFLRCRPHTAGLRDANGRTFLHVAVEKKMLRLVSFVCRTPSLDWILNMQDNDGNTALHLAIHARSFRVFCALLGNRKVDLNLTNNHWETPLDLARSKLPRGMGYGRNSENNICAALCSVWANKGILRRDKRQEKYSRHIRPEDEGKESDRLKDATQMLTVASVLIAAMAFTAAFAIPGGYRADDHTNGGTPTLAGKYIFDAFIMATTLAFICSSVATTGFMFAGTPLVTLTTRSVYYNISFLFLASSLTCISMAFALGVLMMLAPVALGTSVVICLFTPAVLLFTNMEDYLIWATLSRPLCVRKGLFLGIKQILCSNLIREFIVLWPIIVTFGWAGFGRIHRLR